MSVAIWRRQTPFEERGLGEHISRLTVCYEYNIHNQAKAICLVLLLKYFADISVKGLYCNAFLAYSFRSRKQVQKYEEYFIRQKNIPPCPGKGVSLQRHWTVVVRMKRYIYIILGLLAVGLGALGVVVPGLPTTPFILLASWLFVRSSPRLQQWLLASWLGKYIRGYQRRGGMTATQKAGAVGIMTAMVLLSTFVFIPAGSVARIIVPVAGAVGALTVIFCVPNAKKDD